MLDVFGAPDHLFLKDLEGVEIVSLSVSDQLDLAETSLSKTLQDVEVFKAEILALFPSLFYRALRYPTQ